MDEQRDVDPAVDSKHDVALIEQARRQAELAGTSDGNRSPFGATPWKKANQLLVDLPPSGYFPGYEIARIIASGGEGVIYEAVQRRTKGRVAIKALVKGLSSSAQARKRFEREIELIVQLKHAHIVKLFEAGTTLDGLPFYVMDYIEGTHLDLYVESKELSVDRIIRLFCTICRAVQHFHQKGIIHRDLKPSNILVDTHGVPRIVDFGLAKVLSGLMDLTVSANQQLKGTLAYMAPEQTSGRVDDVDTRSDVYSLGVILFRLLTGAFPYPVTGSLTKVLNHICAMPPTPPRKAWRSSIESGIGKGTTRTAARCPFGRDVELIVLTALEKDPERRYSSVQALADDLEHYLKNEPIVPHVSRLYRARKFAQRHKPPIAAAVALLLFTALGVRASMDAHRRELRAWDTTSRLLFSSERVTGSNQWLNTLNEIIESNPGIALAYAMRALLYLEKRNWDAAIADVRRAQTLEPRNAIAGYVEGDCRIRNLDAAGALVAYEDFEDLFLFLDIPRLYYNKAKASRMLGNYERALTDIDRAVALAPERSLTWVARGISKRMTGDIDGAIRDLTQATELDPTWGLQSSLWIWEMLRMRNAPGDVVLSEKWMETASQAVTNDPADKLSLAICQGELKDDNAMGAAKTERSRFFASYYLGSRNLVDGDYGSARKYFERCLTIGEQTREVTLQVPFELELAQWRLHELLAR